MLSPYARERIDNWVGDFCATDDAAALGGSSRDYLATVLSHWLVAVCEHRDRGPDEIEQDDVRHGLLEAARLDLPESVKHDVPTWCAAFLRNLQDVGRLAGGRLLGAFAIAFQDAYRQEASGKSAPIQRPGARIGRNEPCPCGSGKKYKKCCGGA